MKSIVNASLINTAAGLLSMGAGFGSSVIVARALGVEGSGIVAFALWVMTAATLVSDFGMPQAALRYISGGATSDRGNGGFFAALTKRFVVSTAITSIALVGYACWLGYSDNRTDAFIWLATAALFLAYAYSTLSLGAAHGLAQFGRAARRTLTGCIIQPFAVLAGSLLLGPAGAILGHAVRHLPQALDLRHYLQGSKADRNSLTPAIGKYARNVWISGGIYSLLGSRVEIAVIGLSFPMVAVGYYAVGLTMTSLVLQLSLFLGASLVPYFGMLRDSGDHDQLALVYQRGLRWLGTAFAPICFGGAAIAPVFIPALFGAEFEPAVEIAEILFVFSFAEALTIVPMRMMLAHERSSDELRYKIVWGVLNIALLLILVPFFGGYGAAWIKGLMSVFFFVALLRYCEKHHGTDFAPLTLLKIVLAGVLTTAAARLAMHWVPGLPGLCLAVAVGALVYTLAVLALRVIPADEKLLLGQWASAHLPAPVAGLVAFAMAVGRKR